MNSEIKKILNIANEFLEIPSVSFYEKPFLNYLNKKILKLGYNTVLENDYLVVKPKDKTIKLKYLFSVHIDRHGLILNDENKIEYGAFYLKKKLGLDFKSDKIEENLSRLVKYFKLKEVDFELDNRYLKFEKFDLKFEKEANVSFFEKVSLRHVRDKVFSYDIDNGKKINNYTIIRYNQDYSKKFVGFDFDKKINFEKERVFGFESKIKIKDDLFYGQIDNVISAAIIYYLLENTNFNCEVIFTTKEEIGSSYICVLDYMKKRKQNLSIITLDTSPYENFNDKTQGFLTLRKGDENGSFDLKVCAKIDNICNILMVPYNYKPKDTGMTELGRVSFESKGKYNGSSIQLPTLNYHTTYESATILSLENYLKAIVYLIK